MIKLSVIICTYNPDGNIFQKCLHCIEVAIQYYHPFEIIIIDNNSGKPVSEQEYVQGFLQRNHNARIIKESKQGLTNARLTAIKESSGDLLLFIDDDNWITPHFFSNGAAIANNYPGIGAWSGQVKLEFEREPESWTRPYWGLLVHREFESDLWSNLPYLTDSMPCGAGLFVRSKVAEHYLFLHRIGKREIELDRKGKNLLSAGDNDLAACACDIGLGVGLFHQLTLLHYIPASRLSKDYLLNLAENIAASSVILKAYRNIFPEKKSLKNKIAVLLRLLTKPAVERSFYQAVLRGEKNGAHMISKKTVP